MRNYETQGPELPDEGYISGYLVWYYQLNEYYHMLKEIREQKSREMWNGQSDSDNIYFEQPNDGKE